MSDQTTPRPWISYRGGIGWGIETEAHQRVAWVFSEGDAELIIAAVRERDAKARAGEP